jgi:hypothetical protein
MEKLVVPHGDLTAVAFWGGRLELRNQAGAATARTQLPQDVTALASDGKTLFVGLADGRIYATDTTGTRRP